MKRYHDVIDWWNVPYCSIKSINDSQFLILENFYDKELFARYFDFKSYPNIFKRYEANLLNELASTFSLNNNVNWTNNFIYKNIDKLDIQNICINSAIKFNDQFIKLFGDRLDWDRMSLNKNDSWDNNFIETFKNKLNWQNISQNTAIPWSTKFVTKYEDLLDFNLLSSNPSVDWNDSMIARYENLIDFKLLSSNPSVDWNDSLMSKYSEKLYWSELSSNNGIKFDYSLIKKFDNKLVWRAKSNYPNMTGLSGNESVIWDKNLMNDYYNKVDFDVDGIYVLGIFKNVNFPWSIKILEDRFDQIFIKNRYAWVSLASNISIWNLFKPFVNDDNIESLAFSLDLQIEINQDIEYLKDKERESQETMRYIDEVLRSRSNEEEW